MKTAYPNTTQPVSITLYRNVPFDNTYKNHSFIYNGFKYRNKGEIITHNIYPNATQESFLNRKVNNAYVYPRSTLTDTFNFDFKNGLVGNITLELTNEQTNSNYMKVVSGNKSWFYFITSIIQSNIDTYTLTLECDVLMTYGDDFIEGMTSPVFTKRKHCRRYDNGYAFCSDFKNGDSSFNGNVPNIIEKIDELKVNYKTTSQANEMLNDDYWLYIASDYKGFPRDQYLHYSQNGIEYPFSIICVPLKYVLIFQNTNTGSGHEGASGEITATYIIRKLISSGHYIGAKILPYSPFTNLTGFNVIKQNDYTYKFTSNDSNLIDYGESLVINCGNNRLVTRSTPRLVDSNDDDIVNIEEHILFLTKQDDCEYNYQPITISDLVEPTHTITTRRKKDPKLLFKPFKKYCLSSASGQEQEYYLELIASAKPFIYGETLQLNVSTISTGYSGDYTTFTYIKPIEMEGSTYGFNNYKWGKVGLATTMNYTYPVGTNALDVFKATQSQTYYQSKIASGVTSGLSVAGGIASIVIGSGMVATTGAHAGSLTPAGVGMIAGGVMGISSGVAGVSNTIKSTNAKIEDLKNTPDSINVGGSSVAHDMGMNVNGLKPYCITYNSSPVVLDSADDLFYEYGYEVSRMCYFNAEIPTYSDTIDNMLFNRTIFNYIELEEDITMKIKSDIPLIVKQKLSSIFNNGITLWTFLGFTSLNNGTSETDTYNLDEWLYNDYYENAEYKGETY